MNAEGQARKRRWNRARKASLIGHGVLLLAMLVAGLFKGCATKKPPEELIYVEFTVAVPPAEVPAEEPAPDAKEPEPEPDPEPEPEPIPEPTPEPPKPEPKQEPKPESKPPEQPKPKPPEQPKPKSKPQDIRQTNRVTRTPQRGPALSPEEIRRLLNQGAKPGQVTNIPKDPDQRELAAWFNKVSLRMKAGWVQPHDSGAMRGTECVAEVEVDAAGHIVRARITLPSGNAAMDASVQRALDAKPDLPPPPGGARTFSISYVLE